MTNVSRMFSYMIDSNSIHVLIFMSPPKSTCMDAFKNMNTYIWIKNWNIQTGLIQGYNVVILWVQLTEPATFAYSAWLGFNFRDVLSENNILRQSFCWNHVVTFTWIHFNCGDSFIAMQWMKDVHWGSWGQLSSSQTSFCIA